MNVRGNGSILSIGVHGLIGFGLIDPSVTTSRSGRTIAPSFKLERYRTLLDLFPRVCKLLQVWSALIGSGSTHGNIKDGCESSLNLLPIRNIESLFIPPVWS